jgi:hypothetical protein
MDRYCSRHHSLALAYLFASIHFLFYFLWLHLLAAPFYISTLLNARGKYSRQRAAAPPRLCSIAGAGTGTRLSERGHASIYYLQNSDLSAGAAVQVLRCTIACGAVGTLTNAARPAPQAIPVMDLSQSYVVHCPFW